MMDARQALLFAKLAAAKNLLPKDQLKSYVQQQEQQGIPLALILLREKKVDNHAIQGVLEIYFQEALKGELQDPGENLALCHTVLKNKVMSSATLLQVWSEQKAVDEGRPTSLGLLLLKKHCLALTPLIEMYAVLHKETMGCPGCDKEFRLMRLSPGKTLRCKHCKTVFQVPTIEHAIGAYGSSPNALASVSDELLLDDEVPPQIGDYRIIKKIAQGEMGIICQAKHKETGQLVALKILREAYRSSTEAKERFKREALTVKQKLGQHTNIVGVFDVGIDKQIPFFTMEFIEGHTLSEVITQQMLSPERCVEIIIKLCDGLHYAHSKGIIHRDIKPSNILLDKNGEPRIADFGLAKCLDSSTLVTRSGSLIGTPYYMSPEQARGQTGLVGPRSDLYSLGVVFYEMLTGQNPFQGKDTVEIYQNILTLNPPPPSKVNAQVPKFLDNICLKCLKKNSFQRYKSAEEMGLELRQLHQGKQGWWNRMFNKH
jgi:tRNA A-37 threonylcarbamoyl transferase component Bud32